MRKESKPDKRQLMQLMISNHQVKTVAKAAVHQYWLQQLRCKADTLSSLQYLKTKYLSLSRPHPILWSCGSSPWEVEKGTAQSRLLSGRARLEALSSHWVPWNRGGLCTLPMCWALRTPIGEQWNIFSSPVHPCQVQGRLSTSLT